MKFQTVLNLSFGICSVFWLNLSFATGSGSGSDSDFVSPWTWVCRDQLCVKIDKKALRENEVGVPVALCKLNCDKHGTLLPRPTGQVDIGKQYFRFYPESVHFSPLQAENSDFEHLFREGTRIFSEYLRKVHANSKCAQDRKETVSQKKVFIAVKGAWYGQDKTLTLKTDESYELSIHHDKDKANLFVTITANTYFGARNGLETLSQLIAADDEEHSLATVTRATVHDKPVYPYRGLMLDTSRNFYSVDSIKRIIDGMSYVKLNMLHWHITDTHSFPFFSKREPKLTQYGAYSKQEVYSIADMEDIVAYARVRGVKVVPEFDQPAHTGNGWQWGHANGLGDLALCVNKEPWQKYCVEPPCGQLNVVNDNLFPILGKLYSDFLDIFDKDLFHMGGDEINYNCWNSSSEIRDWLRKDGKDLSQDSFIELWGWFQHRAYGKLKDANRGHDLTAILWTSDITDDKHIKKYLDNTRYVIQIWSKSDDPAIASLIDKHYRVIFSNYDAWYLDCGYGGWVGSGPNNWCSPYKGWQQVYENDPIKIYANLTNPAKAEHAFKHGLVLGGTAPLWSEQADEQSADSKIFPRAAALAERLWTNPSYEWHKLEYRMVEIRRVLVERGIHADRLQPEWCYQNEGHCNLDPTIV